MKTVAGNQVEEALNDRATEQAPLLNFTKPKSNSCCKKAVGSTPNDPVFNIPVAEESSFESLNERNKGKGVHFNKSLSYNHFCPSFSEDNSTNLLQKRLQIVSGFNNPVAKKSS